MEASPGLLVRGVKPPEPIPAQEVHLEARFMEYPGNPFHSRIRIHRIGTQNDDP